MAAEIKVALMGAARKESGEIMNTRDDFRGEHVSSVNIDHQEKHEVYFLHYFTKTMHNFVKFCNLEPIIQLFLIGLD